VTVSEPQHDAGPTSYRALIAVPGLFQLLASAAFARTATKMISVILVLFVLDVYHSPALSGVVILVSLVPGMCFSPIAGTLLDRRGRVALIGIDYFVGGLTFSLLATLSLLGHLPRPALLVIVGIGGLTQPLSNAGTRSLVPAMVPVHLWDRANAVDSTGYVIANVCGPAIAGAAVALVGARGALFLPAGALALASLLLVGLKVPNMATAAPGRILADARAGVIYVWNNLILRMAGITLSFYFGSYGVLSVTLPLVLEHRLHHGAVAVGVAFAAAGATGFVSGLIAGRVGTAGREHWLFAGAGFITAGAIVLLALTPSLLMAFFAMAAVGATNGPLTVAMFSVRQRATDPVWFGRAFAISMTLNGLGNPIGAAVAGLLAGGSIVSATLFGAALATCAGIIPIAVPGLHSDRELDALDASGATPLAFEEI
jgi:MFS family permease